MMKIWDIFLELMKKLVEHMKLKNKEQERILRCQACTMPYMCVQNLVLPVFSAFYGRQFIAEELYCECVNCLLRIALPAPLSEHDSKLLQRKLERHPAKVLNKPFADVVKAHLVTVTSEYVLILM